MDLPLLSLIALIIAIVLSCFSRINVGLVSIALTFVVGTFVGKMKLAEILTGFPTGMFLTLLGITLLFGQARVNGTLDQLAQYAVRLARGNPGAIPIIFFVIAFLLASIGPGNIAATAMLAPIAMAIAGRTGITAFLMSIMLINGATAGAFSPFAPTGIIANDIMARIGMPDMEWRNFLNTFMAQSFVAFAGYFSLGGLQLFRQHRIDRLEYELDQPETVSFNTKQKLTLGVIAALILGAILFRIDITLGAFIGVTILSICRAADEEAAVKAVPWNAILMVSGVMMLVSLLEKGGGMDLFTALLARFSNQETITGFMAFVTGVISVYSSSSGVVLPAFLPTIPGLVTRLGGGDPLAIASSINVGAHLVDVSPLSTLGAICIASAASTEDRNALFTKMLLWGLSMALVGALVCFLFFGLLA